MHKVFSIMVLLAVAASPALAEIIYEPMNLPTDRNTIGVIDPNNPGTLNMVYIDPAAVSDNFTVTFGMHLGDGDGKGYSQYGLWLQHFCFIYDNSGLEVLHAQPTGPWTGMGAYTGGLTATNNYGSNTTMWDSVNNATTGEGAPAGTTGIYSLAHGWFTLTTQGQTITPTNFTVQNISSVVPFFQVQMHMHNTIPDQFHMFAINAMFVSSVYTGIYSMTTADFDFYGGVAYTVPEPTSLVMLCGSLAMIGGFVVRRRR